MTLELLFWVCMILWLVFGGLPVFRQGKADWPGVVLSLLPWLAVLFLGWATLGPPIHS